MSLSVSNYVKQFYKGNSFGAVQDEREKYDTQSLVSADMQAVRRALKELRSYDYDGEKKDSDDDENKELFKKVQAYVSTYNNFVDSTSGIGNEELDRQLSKLKKMSGKLSSQFEAVGIKIQKNGKLKIDTDKLEASSRIKIRKIFSEDSEYGPQVEKHMKQIKNLIRLKNLGAPVSRPASKVSNASELSENMRGTDMDDDAQLAQLLAEALEGNEINYTA